MNYRKIEKIYMISCNDLTVSLCSISCPISAERICSWYWLIVLNWILFQDMKCWSDFEWLSRTLKQAHHEHFESSCCVKSGSPLCFIFSGHTCGCQQFTFCMFTKFILTDVTLLVLSLQLFDQTKMLPRTTVSICHLICGLEM